ncbi:DUF2007 domain-containing protein [Vibrio sp. S4M6]|uniref:putative signal transducing protein n=1 Tax=Vibrio sinus TaxID=2946865 RepID=UPI00202A13B1|nr:DUF2007 domain-containing protein [Vibrio sinus]MCL9782373.1 DUF2007 domain-containing protein [Vibrio sinus]
MKLYTATNPTEAHLVCELLRSEQIDCEVRGEHLFGLQGELPFGEDTEPYVWLLNPYHADKASTIVAEYVAQKHSPKTHSDWQCSQCGEHNEGQFAICWKCGNSDSSAN